MPDDRFLHRRAGHSEKVAKLSDLEYRVWTQYLLSADDFGVMRASALTLQADNDSLASRTQKVIGKALEGVIAVGLLDVFEHQGRKYVFQQDWQDWQKVEYPRATNEPRPSDDVIERCDESTQRLFDAHPGGKGRRTPKRSENVPQTIPEELPATRAGVPAKRLTANGKRLTANGLEESPRETAPPLEQMARELVSLYPAQARCAANLVTRALWDALYDTAVDGDTAGAWESIKGRLEQQKRSHQWRVKQMIPRLDRWLSSGAHLQELPENPVATLVSEKTNLTLASAAEFIKDGTHGSR